MDPRDLFEILVRENAESVRAFLLGWVRDPATVEDLFQETFLVAWRNLGRYDRQLPFGPWVRGIAGKLLLNHRRRLGRARVAFCDERDLQLLDRSFEEFRALPGDTFDEKLDVLRACLGKLSAQQRDAIRMHYEHGLHCKEIGVRLGLGFEAVKKHLQRGRAALLRCMQGSLPQPAASEATP
jgi:RNA polymerase sigma-70 factor (ECF subfamily)